MWLVIRLINDIRFNCAQTPLFSRDDTVNLGKPVCPVVLVNEDQMDQCVRVGVVEVG